MILFGLVFSSFLGTLGPILFAQLKYAERIYWAFEVVVSKPTSVMLLTKMSILKNTKDETTNYWNLSKFVMGHSNIFIIHAVILSTSFYLY